ncbi:hypothetical protein [Providencia stuartii]|uniref:hypothetical protein n=1 Tax=Providencia stuartii TaxID=588 RepID=UPI0011224FBB|nr:hypothetical protein [Providencia stuartii]
MTKQLTIHPRYADARYIQISNNLKLKRAPKFNGVQFVRDVIINLADSLGLNHIGHDQLDTDNLMFAFLVNNSDDECIYHHIMNVFINNGFQYLTTKSNPDVNYESIKISIDLCTVEDVEVELVDKVNFIYKYNEQKPSFEFIFDHPSVNYPSTKYTKEFSTTIELPKSELSNECSKVVQWMLTELEKLS